MSEASSDIIRHASPGALIPLAAGALAPPVAAATGLTRASFLGTPFEDVFWSFFFVSYPFFLFAIVYGTARVAVLALSPGPRRAVRLLLGPVAILLFLGACLHPTFGGLVLRAGFATGGIGFLRGQPAAVALALGGMAGGTAFATALGLAGSLLWPELPSRAGLHRAAWHFASLVLAGPLLIAGQRLILASGFAWPLTPLGSGEALLAALAVAASFLPHAFVVWRTQAPRPLAN